MTQLGAGQVPATIVAYLKSHPSVNYLYLSFQDLDAGDTPKALEFAAAVRAMTDVLGLDPLSARWSEAGGNETPTRQALVELVEGLLAERQQARAEKDYARADAARDRLQQAGIVVEDTPNGPQWTIKS